MCNKALLIVSCLAIVVVHSQPTRTTSMGSSTLTCIDKDGDGYGVGCPLGPDADDYDPTINTAASWTGRYSSLYAFLTTQRGYSINPSAPFYYISATGNDSTGAVNDITHPYATWHAVSELLYVRGAGAAVVVWRAGTYAETIGNDYPTVQGTSGNILLLIAYPGEAVIMSGASGGFENYNGGNYITIDGFDFEGTTGLGECIQWDGSSGGSYGLTVRNVKCNNFGRGYFMMDGIHQILIEDTISANAANSHTLYFGARSNPMSDITIRRNIFYGSPLDGIHINGRSTNLDIENNIIYNITSPSIALQNGGGSAIVRNNLIFAGDSACLQVGPYSHTGYGFDVPEPDIATLLIENNTCWTSNYTYETGQPGQSDYMGFIWTLNGNQDRSFNHTIVRNNIIYTHTEPAIWFGSQSQLANFTFQNNVFYRSDGGAAVLNYGDPYQDTDFGNPMAPSVVPYTLAQLVAVNAANTGNVTTDPQFIAQSTAYVNAPSSFNFHLQSGSSAINAGSGISAPVVDLWGNARDASPDIGAYEYGATTPLTVCLMPPSVTLTSPSSGGTVTGTSATLEATATASCGTLSKITFASDSWSYAIDAPICTTSPCSVSFDSTRLSPGSREFWAVAVDSYGNSANSAVVTATVSNTCITAPGALLANAGAGSAINSSNYNNTDGWVWVNIDPKCGEIPASGNSPISGLAANNVLIDAIPLYDAGNPTCFNQNGQEMSCSKFLEPGLYSTGPHAFRAYGADSYGNLAFSGPSAISVNNVPPADTSPPTGVAITSPTDGISLSGTITVTATCTDNTACAGMLLLVDGNAVNWVGTSPWQFSLNTATLAPGSHALSVLASDAAANSTTSATVAVVVRRQRPPLRQRPRLGSQEVPEVPPGGFAGSGGGINRGYRQQIFVPEAIEARAIHAYISTASGTACPGGVCGLQFAIYSMDMKTILAETATAASGGTPDINSTGAARFVFNSGTLVSDGVLTLPAGSYWLLGSTDSSVLALATCGDCRSIPIADATTTAVGDPTGTRRASYPDAAISTGNGSSLALNADLSSAIWTPHPGTALWIVALID